MMRETITKEDIDGLIRGDQAAYRRVYEAFGSRLYYFSKKLGLGSEDAEEIVQETFLRLWLVRSTLDTKSSIEGLIIIIARNLIYNALKKAAVRKQHQLLLDKSGEQQVEQCSEELRKLIVQAVDEMPEKRREVFKLSRFEGWLNDQIAVELGISKKTVENQLNKALNYLRQRLKESGYSIIILLFV